MLQIDGVIFIHFDDILLVLCCVICLPTQHIHSRHRKDIVIMWKCTQHCVKTHCKLTGNVTSQAHKPRDFIYFVVVF